MKTREQRQDAGFTWIELLVVIAIIAILLTLLFSAVNRSRERAAMVVCKSNLRELWKGCTLYASDNDGDFPGAWNWLFSDMPQGNWQWTEWAKEETVKLGKIYPYIGDNPRVFVCPTFNKVYKQIPSYSHLTAYASYSMNEIFPSKQYQGRVERKEAPVYRWNQVERPSELVLLAEENPYQTDYNLHRINNMVISPPQQYSATNPAIRDGLATFHLPPAGDLAEGVSNVCFVDGHVETRHTRDTIDLLYPYRLRNP